MFNIKFLLLFLFIYGKNVVETTDTSAISNPSPGSGADSANKTGGSDAGLAAGDDAKGCTSATPKLKLFKDDGSGNPVEMETSDFSQINYSGYLIYEFKPRVDCTLVKFGDAEVWKKGNHQVEEPISVSYNCDEHKVVLFDDKKSVFYKRDNSGNWVHHLTKQRNEPASTDTSGSGEGEGTTVELGSLYPDSGGSTVEVKAKSAPSEAGLGSSENEGTTVELGSLYPDSYGSTVDATPKSATPGSENAGKEAGEPAERDGSDSKPSETDQSPSIPSAGSDGDSSTVNPDQDGTDTTAAETVKKTPVELDIKKDAGTDEFNYNKDGKIVTFTAKDNYVFKLVKDEKTEIWKTDKESEYASKLVLDGKGSGTKTVTLHLLDGTNKSYKKDGKDKPWYEYTGPLPSTDQSGVSGIHTSGSSGSESGGSSETGIESTLSIIMSRHRP